MARGGRLTWRDVSSPNFGSGVSDIARANLLLQNSIGGLSDSLGSFRDSQISEQERQLGHQRQDAQGKLLGEMLLNAGDSTASQGVAQRAGQFAVSNPNLVDAEFVKNFRDLYGSSITDNTGQVNLDELIRSNTRTAGHDEASDAATMLTAQANEYYARGDRSTGDQIMAEANQLIGMSGQKNADAFNTTRTGSIASNTTDIGARQTQQIQRNAEGRAQTNFNQSQDDRFSLRNVENLAGVAIAASADPVTQRAFIAQQGAANGLSNREIQQAMNQLDSYLGTGSTDGGSGSGARGQGATTTGEPTPFGINSVDTSTGPDTTIGQELITAQEELTRYKNALDSGGLALVESARQIPNSSQGAAQYVKENFPDFEDMSVKDIQENLDIAYRAGATTWGEAATVIGNAGPRRSRTAFGINIPFTTSPTYAQDIQSTAALVRDEQIARDREQRGRVDQFSNQLNNQQGTVQRLVEQARGAQQQALIYPSAAADEQLRLVLSQLESEENQLSELLNSRYDRNMTPNYRGELGTGPRGSESVREQQAIETRLAEQTQRVQRTVQANDKKIDDSRAKLAEARMERQRLERKQESGQSTNNRRDYLRYQELGRRIQRYESNIQEAALENEGLGF